MTAASTKLVLVTGADGFIGRNLCVHLERSPTHSPLKVTRDTPGDDLSEYIRRADAVVHLAGVNRPEDVSEFHLGNAKAVDDLCAQIESIRGEQLPAIFSSSTQADYDNPYGASKLAAEEVLKARASGKSPLRIFRLPNVFGKWCRPNYNSVVATFCHNLLRDIPITVHDPETPMRLVHVDDVVGSFIRELDEIFSEVLPEDDPTRASVAPVFEIQLGELANRLRTLAAGIGGTTIPDLTDPLTKRLQSTLLSYLPLADVGHDMLVREDDRGGLFELLRSEGAGQVFVSTTRPGITRGNHFHHLKNERFCVISGEARIRMRQLGTDEVVSIDVSGAVPTSISIIPGYTHSIENVGPSDMITIFWANEPFDPQQPDTYFEKV